MSFLKKLFGIGPKVNFEELVANGAILIDVRSVSEFQSGHCKGSINIPLDQLNQHIKKIKSLDQTIITCCASGMRSASAKNVLNSKGYTSVHNGGSWQNMKKFEGKFK